MHITVDNLRRVSAALFDRLEARGYETIDVPHDYYWDIDRVQRRPVPKQTGEGAPERWAGRIARRRAKGGGRTTGRQLGEDGLAQRARHDGVET